MLDLLINLTHFNNDFYIILAKGEFPKNPLIINLIKSAKALICCDGAINSLLKINIKPDIVIGDLDSIEFDISNQNIYKIKITDQNSNDLTKAVKYAKKMDYKNLIILGATGYREDHTIANIALLAKYYKIVKNCSIISDYGIFTAHQGKSTIKTFKGQQISFFTFNSKTKISCTNLKWPLKNHAFNFPFEGTLNEALDLNITFDSDDITIIYRSFELKNNNFI